MTSHATHTSPPRRLRALVIAELANPEWASVPLVGWSHARALMDVADVHLVTQIRNRDPILRTGLPERDGPGAFTAIDSEAIAAPASKLTQKLRGGSNKGWTVVTALLALTYPYFEWCIWKRFGKRIAAGEWDVVHRITPLSPTIPSLLAPRVRKAGVPFVLGPLNGGVPWPKAFDAERRKEREWLSYVRSGYKLLPGYRSTRAASSAIMIGSRDTLAQMPARYHDRCVYVPENAFDPARFPPPAPTDPPRPVQPPLRIVFLGRLVPYKCADILLAACADLIRAGKVDLEIIGDGPEMPAVRAQASALGIADLVRFVGWVPHDKVQQRLRQAHVLGCPSIREFGGGVVLEAMAMGLVPLVVNYGGPAELVTEQTGIAVPIAPRPELTASVQAAVERLVADPAMVTRMGHAAAHRAGEWFSWPRKAEQTLAVWEWVSGRRSAKPDFGMPLGAGNTGNS